MTEWRDIPGYEGIYQVSAGGAVRRVDRYIPRLLKPSDNGKGYLAVRLSRGGKAKTFQIGHLVLAAFVAPRPEGMECCHNDGDRTNNVPENLRWDTRSANTRDQLEHGTHANAKKTHCKQGHPFSGDNLVLTVRQRGCRTCMTNWRATRERGAA